MKNKLFKSVFGLILALMLCFGLAACNACNPAEEPAGQQYTVTFNVQGHGTAPAAQTVDEGGYATEPTAPTAEGWTFEGWYKETSCTNAFTFTSEKITGDVTVYAKWTEKKSVTPPPPVVEYDDIETSLDYGAIEEYLGGVDKTKIIKETHTFGRFTVAGSKAYLNSKTALNTQGCDVSFELKGVTNSVSFKITCKSSKGCTLSIVKVTNDNETVVKEWPTLENSGDIVEVNETDLEAGSYIIRTVNAGALEALKITEKLQRGDATSIKVVESGAKTSYLAGEPFSADGLQVYLVYDNGREDLLTEGYTVDSKGVDMNTAGTYTINVIYTAKNFKASYEITVTAIATENALTLYTTVVKSQKPQSLQKVFKVGDTFNSTNLTVYAKSGSDEMFRLEANQYTVALQDGNTMSTAGEKTVVVDTTFGISTEYKIYVLDLSGVNKTGDASVTVDANATVGVNGNVITVKTVTDAVKVYELLGLSSDVVKPINVADGEYYEMIYINVPNIQINGSATKTVQAGTVANGEDKNNGAVIWYDGLAGEKDPVGSTYGTFGSASVYVGENATGFVANNITFKNKYNTKDLFDASKQMLQDKGYVNANGNYDTQAVALRIDSASASFYNCKMTGYHDTLFIYGGNSYFENCWVEGHTDYIFGCESSYYFYHCKIYTLGDNTADNGGYVVANRPDTDNRICVFNACDFDGDDNVVAGTIALGRPWGPKMKMVILNSTISGKFSKAAHTGTTNKGQRYVTMSSNNPVAANMMEYNNTGDGAITASLPDTCTVLTSADAYEYSKVATILGFAPGTVDTSKAYLFENVTLGSATGTVESPSTYFDGDVEIVGTHQIYTTGSGSIALNVNSGAVITLKVKGAITISWFGSGYGSAEDAMITYEDGYATIKIIRADNNCHINSIKVDTQDIPADTEFVTVTIYGEDGTKIDDITLIKGETITLEKVQALVTDGVIDKVYTSDEKTAEFNFSGAINEDTPLYITLAEIELQTITDGLTLGSRGSLLSNEYVTIDGVTVHNGKYLLLSGSSSITVKVSAGTVISIYGDNNIGSDVKFNDVPATQLTGYIYKYTAEAEETVVITSTGTTYIMCFNVNSNIVYAVGDEIAVGSDYPSICEGYHGAYHGVEIDASTSKWDGHIVNGNHVYAQANSGVVLTFKVAAGVTAENIKVYYYTGSLLTEDTDYTVEINDGVATVTVIVNTYISKIAIA